MKDLEKCVECKIEYPFEILSPMMTNDGATGGVCGICALELSNQYLGIKRKKFSGEMAEEYRQDAIKWRKKQKNKVKKKVPEHLTDFEGRMLEYELYSDTGNDELAFYMAFIRDDD